MNSHNLATAVIGLCIALFAFVAVACVGAWSMGPWSDTLVMVGYSGVIVAGTSLLVIVWSAS